MKHPKFAIIYHDADFDGKLSNEVCRYHLSLQFPDATIHSYGWDYGRPVPNVTQTDRSDWYDYDNIYIVDLSVDELMARPELREKIIWIDHHKSAIEKWDRKNENTPGPGMFTGVRIDGVAACRLCWNWFIGDENSVKQDFVDRKVSEPTLIRLAGEYDIWDNRDPDAKVLQFGLCALSPGKFAALVHYQFSCGPREVVDRIYLNPVLESGRAIKSYCDKQNDEYSNAFSHTIKFAGLTMCALNIGQRGNSDLLRGGLKPEHQACFAWRHVGAGENPVYVSLYHIDGHTDLDLSEIAKNWGGGGHRGACGFRTDLIKLGEILASNL